MSLHSWHDPHIVHSAKTFLKALYITLGVFLFLFVLFHIGGALYVSSIATKSSEAFHAGILKDQTYLKTQGDAIAQNDSLIQNLLAKDSDAVLAIVERERSARNIGLIGVANAEGIIVSRTLSKSNLGQNVFLTVPAGRFVAEGKSVQSIERTGFGNQLFMTTARPIIHEGEMVGALFANYLTNDEYAIRFRDTYLPAGAEVLFYTKEFGVYGESFSDPVKRNLIDSYFNSGSEWTQNASAGKTISFNGNSFYLVENIVFPGLEQSPGGALIFIPRQDISDTLNFIIALLTLCVFIFFALRHHRRSRGEEHGWRYYTLLAAALVPIFVLALFALHAQNIGYLKLERIPYALYNSTLRLQPEYGIYDVGFEQRFSVMVDTGDESVNAVQVGLVFDPKKISIKEIEIASSTCLYMVENTIDNVLGRANLSCVLFDEGEDRDSLRIANVVVVPKQVGTFTLSFDEEETKVLANDGLGTDVLRMAQSGSYRVDNFDSTIATNTLRSFVVFSPTHPNQSRWYNDSEVRFVWKGKPGAVYRYEFDSSPSTVPSNSHTIQDSSITIPVPGDGIFYFHLQLVSGGPIAHYLVQIDRTPPSIIDIHSSSENVVIGDVVRFSFEAEDAGSGVQRNYYIDLGNHLFLPAGSNLFVPFLKVGDQKVVLRVYDGANNYSEKSKIIHVEAR
ncbi:MAG: hypothetical protein V4664_03705 [Patescibacteria group bacterium]